MRQIVYNYSVKTFQKKTPMGIPGGASILSVGGVPSCTVYPLDLMKEAIMPKNPTIKCPVTDVNIPTKDCVTIRCKYHGFWSGIAGCISGCQYKHVKEAQANLLKQMGGDK